MPLRQFTETERRVWQEVAAYVRAHSSKEQPLAFNRIKNGVTGRR
jgi:hypothetical protein